MHIDSSRSPDMTTPPLSPLHTNTSPTNELLNSIVDGPADSAHPDGHADAAATARVNAEVNALLTSMVDDEPSLPETEAFFRCHAKRRLYRALKQAGIKPVAEWLFSAPRRPFHVLVPHPTFEYAVAILGKVADIPADDEQPGGPESITHQTSSMEDFDALGKKILFVPVTIVRGRILGYTFSACNCGPIPEDPGFNDCNYHIRSHCVNNDDGDNDGDDNGDDNGGDDGGDGVQVCMGVDARNSACPMGIPHAAFMPHAVGRFSFSPSLSDLLIVAHGLACDTTGIMHMRNGRDGDTAATTTNTRDRAWFAVPAADYGFRRLPGRIVGILYMPERRLDSHPRFQFPSPPPPSPDMSVNLRDGMAALERLVKGRFVCDRICKDKMDPVSGQMLSRITFSAQFEFDVEDAISVNVFRDLAIRSYYSYMSTTSNETESTVPSLQS